MKNDPYFKLVATAILAGVIIAFATPPQTARPFANSAPTVVVASAAEAGE